jgi:hypothetical protein
MRAHDDSCARLSEVSQQAIAQAACAERADYADREAIFEHPWIVKNP